MDDFDNETWLIDVGDGIITKQAEDSDTPQSPIERLIYCLWVADYGMRNAGDLATAVDFDEDFHLDGRRISADLGLRKTAELFLRNTAEFELVYFNVFDDVCDELRRAYE